MPRSFCSTTIVAGRATILGDVSGDQARCVATPFVTVDGGHFVLHEDSGGAAGLIRRFVAATD